MKYIIEVTLNGPAPATGDLVLEDARSILASGSAEGYVTDLDGTNVGWWEAKS